MTKLAPDIQEKIMDFEPTIETRHRLQEEGIRQIAIERNWSKQRVEWNRLKSISEPS